MLVYVENEGKTYEERMMEAVTDIPLYTSEWTNFNPSDPAMTILETLLGFETLQQDSMDDIPLKVRQNLLKLVGFNIKKGKGARLLLSAANVQEAFTLPTNHKFRIGDMVFDPFVGSGTTAVVANKLGRRYLGIERERKYVALSLKRLQDAKENKQIQGYENGIFKSRNSCL